jgi:hypothetical protein
MEQGVEVGAWKYAGRALKNTTHGCKGVWQILLAGVGVGRAQNGIGVLGVRAGTAEEARSSSANNTVSSESAFSDCSNGCARNVT